MDPGQNGKRPRLESWSASAPTANSLPHPHTSSTPRPHPQPLSASSASPPAALPLPTHSHSHSHSHPLPLSHHPHKPSGPAPYQQPYPPRPTDRGPGPLVSVPVLGHDSQLQHPDPDRRRLEQETLAPMQDPYRHPAHHSAHHPSQLPSQLPSQPPSPALPPYQQYSPRDFIIKREAGDNHPSRANSAGGHVPDSLAHTPHFGSSSHPPATHPPPAYPGEGRPRHMGYDNEASVPPSQAVYRPTTYAPPPPPTHHVQYEPPSTFTPAPEPFYGVYTTSSSSSSAKKKNTRASQACDQCRQLKAKCDETKPCKSCRDKGTECKYRDPAPKATDKTQADILDGITAIHNNLNSLMDQINRMEDRMTKMETFVTGVANGDSHVREDSPFESAEVDPDVHEIADGSTHDCAATEPERVPRLMAEDEPEAEPGPPVPPGEPAIPINHTTLAGLLLNWPCIKDMVKPHLETEGIRHVQEYPISHEQNRGVLIVHGRGEDSHPSRLPRQIASDNGQIEIADDSSDTASPSPAADWGYLGGFSPADQVVEYKGGVLANDGYPDFQEEKVWRYVASFRDNILNMHPIVQPKVLQEWIRHFLDTLPPRSSRSRLQKSSTGAFAVSSISPNPASEFVGSKRKRSPAPDGFETPPAGSPARSGRLERSIHNALVLTILALGKICLARSHVPDAVHQVDPLHHGSPSIRNGIPPSPSLGSPPTLSSQSLSSGLTSPKETEHGFHSRRSSTHGSVVGVSRSGGLGLKKNYENIPGLEYFAFATDILGNHAGAYKNMKNVYALIFAGLYHGQLARPMESFAFIHQASHKLMVIMRPSLDKLRRIKNNFTMIQEVKYNQMALTFWTCLQLESDLIAELQLPPSGLLSYEENMPHPNMSLLEGFKQEVLDSYPAQLYLRTHLNSIHRMFYAPERDNKEAESKDLDAKFNNVGSVADAVSDMKWVAKSFIFADDDPPADNILAARLRAKYWGAQVITYRPFIRQILQWSDSMQKHPSSPSGFAVSEFRQGVTAPVIDPSTRSPKEIPAEVKLYAKRAIKALVESTRAFHRLGPERPIITNVFGTAHAQWGNLLVLSACSRNQVLKEWVDMDLLQELFKRTIQFLHQSSTATNTLRTDMHILEGVYRDLFQQGDIKTTGSFSSNPSLQQSRLPMAAPPPVSSFGHGE